MHRGRRQHGGAHRPPALRRALPHARARPPCSPPPATACSCSPPTSRPAAPPPLAAVAAARGVTLVDALELGATGVAPAAGGLRGGRAARSGRRAPPRALTVPAAVAVAEDRDHRDRHRRWPSRAPPTLEAGLTPRPVANVARRGVGAPGRRARAPGEHRQEFAAAWANGQAFLARRAGPARASAVAGRVEGPHAGARRRGGAGRPPRRPRVADQLQVPVQGARQRRAGAALRARTGRRTIRPRGGRLVRGGRTRRLPGAVRARSAASSAPVRRCRRTPPTSRPRTAPSCAPTSTPAGHPTRRPPTARSPSRWARRRPTAGVARSPSAPRPRPSCGGCSASAARPTSCSVPSATARSGSG